MARRPWPTGAGCFWIRPRSRAVHPREGRRTIFLASVGHQLLGWVVDATRPCWMIVHYRGLLRVARRAGRYSGLRRAGTWASALDAAAASALSRRAGRRGRGPLRAATRPDLSYAVRRLRYAAPQWRGELRLAAPRAGAARAGAR